jgi:DnaK suppressor protein
MTQNTTHPPAFITEMKQRLVAEKEQIQAELATVAKKHDGDFQAQRPDYGRSEEDNATEVADYLAFSSTTEALEERLEQVEAALQRIEDGTYGMTRDGELIPEQRLRANPAATTLVQN